MQKLLQGIHTFQRDIFGGQKAMFESLANGQTPETLFITCSDSRINPHLLTQTEPGDLFILRNVGNIVPPHGASNGSEAAAIEYAVTVLNVRDIVICGHSHCGAMAGILDPSTVETLPSVKGWLTHAEATARIVKGTYGHVEGPARLMVAVEENVLVQVEHLRTLPPVAAALSAGTLKVHGWVYKIETGEVFAYDADQAQFLPLKSGAQVIPGARRVPIGKVI